MLRDRDIVAIVELVFYVPLAVLALFLCIRHGFTKSSGWVSTVSLCVVRIVGSVCQIISNTDHSPGLLRAIVIVDSIGLSPLLFATLGVLHRFIDFINAQKPSSPTQTPIRVIQLVMTLAPILAIVGGTSSKMRPSANGTIQVPLSSKLGIILYIGAFIGILVLFAISVPNRATVPKQERRVPIALAFALPLVFVRLVYSVAAVFLHNHTFNIVDGSVPVWVCMALVEEVLVIIIYVTLGFMLKRVDVQAKKGGSGAKATLLEDRQEYERVGEEYGGHERGREEYGGHI